MFIVTAKGNYVPIENVDFIKPTKTGSLIMLKSGKQATDTRTPLEIFEQLTPSLNNNALATSIYQELEQVKQEVATLASGVYDATQLLAAEVSQIKTVKSELSRSSTIAREAVESVEKSVSKVTKIIEVLDEAIKEVVIE